MDELHGQAPVSTFEAPASMDHWEAFNEFVDLQADQFLGPGKRNYSLRLACEELLSNMIRHSTDGDISRQVTIYISSYLIDTTAEGRSLLIQIQDNAPHFDPNLDEDRVVDRNMPVTHRPIGGLGLFLVQQSVDRVEYDWVNHMNRYRLYVDIDTSSEPA